MSDPVRAALAKVLARLELDAQRALPPDTLDALVSLHGANRCCDDGDDGDDGDDEPIELLAPEALRLERHASTGRRLGEDIWNEPVRAYYDDPLPHMWSMTFAKTRDLGDRLMLMIGGRAHGQVLSWDLPHPDIGGREAWSLPALAARRASPQELASPSGPPMSARWQAELRRAGVVLFEGCALVLAHRPAEEIAQRQLERALGRPIPEDLDALWSVATRGIVFY